MEKYQQPATRCDNGPSVKGASSGISTASCKSYPRTPARVLGAALCLLALLQLLASVAGSQAALGQQHSFQVFSGNRSSGLQLLEARRRLLAAASSTSTSISTQASTVLPQLQEAARKQPGLKVNNSVQGESRETSLHFGAKLALAILSFVILLVACATLLDYRLSSATYANRKRRHFYGSLSSLSSTPAQSQQQHQQQQQAVRNAQQHQQSVQQQHHLSALRDQRSPSLSSSSSCSTLLCSIVSSTTPILSCAPRHSPRLSKQVPHPASGLGPAQLAVNEHWVPWLRLFQLVGLKGLPRHTTTTSGASKWLQINAGEGEKREPEVVPQDDESQWRGTEGKCDSGCPKQPNGSATGDSGEYGGKFCQQLLLAFSLKQTARHIFNRPARGDISSRHQYKQLPASQTASRQLLPTVMQEEHVVSDEADCLRPNHEPKPCIESLHGLRCLSMIWIIVVHSYHFALKSLFAPPGPTNLYKTIVSQLLANGSFACDSFFFAAGFLLAYLALPAKQFPCKSTSGEKVAPNRALSGSQSNEHQLASHHHQQHQEQHQDCDSISSLSSASESTKQPSSSKELRTQRTCTSGGAPNQNQNQPHRYHLNNIVICHNTTNQFKKLTDKSCCCAPPPAHIHNNNNNNHHHHHSHTNEFTFATLLGNLLHRYIRMMPLMMAIIGLSASLLRYLGEGPLWEDSTLMYDKWCRKNWWINVLFIHNFLKRENMCLSHSWYAAVDIQLFTLGQLILFVLFRNKRLGLLLCALCLLTSQLINGASTLIYHLPAVPLVANFSEQTMNLYYGLIYIKPYCRASPYLVGILLAFLMRRTSLRHIRLRRWQVVLGWTLALTTLAAILLAMRPAMNGDSLSELESALYSSLSRPLWACAIAWMIYACITGRGGPFASILEARCFFPLSQLSYPAFLIHPIVIAIFYGSHQAYSFQFSHYLMLYIIIGNIVITYASAFVLSALFEFPLLSLERTIKRAYANRRLAKREPHKQVN